MRLPTMRSRRARARDVDEEIDFHLSMAAAAGEREGLSPVAARRAAERAFGDRRAVHAACLRQHRAVPRAVVAAAMVLLAAWGWVALATSPRWARVSPFTAVAIVDHHVRVRLPNAGEYALLAIDGIETEQLLTTCRDVYAERCDKRFAEDLVEVMQHAGRTATVSTVDLRLRDLQSGHVVLRRDQAMTRANRRAVYAARNGVAAWCGR